MLTSDLPEISWFAALCDDAAEHGLKVALEFMPFSGVADLAAAMRIVSGADRPNSGVLFDVCHFVRSGGSITEIDATAAARIASIQIGDGLRHCPADLRDEAMFGRLSPGDGDFGVATLLAALRDRGVSARIGPEVYRRGWSERAPDLVASDLMAATRSVLPHLPDHGGAA